MATYFSLISEIHDVMNDGGRLGEITRLMERIGEWAKKQSEIILTMPFFFNPEHEKAFIAELGEELLDVFDAFGIDNLRYRKENGTSFQFGTVFDSEGQPVFTIFGAEFYAENGKRYDRISKIPVDQVVCYWYNDVPRGWFIKLPNYDTGKTFILELEKIEIDD